MLRVEMLCTGDEVLHGQIVDTNAAWLANYLFEQGMPMSSRMTVGDNLSALVAAMTERSLRADVLIVNGGLGPTSDDLSALAAATAAGDELVEHAEWLAKMAAYFAERGRDMAPSNRKQALIPASAELIDNPVGTACGFALQLNRCLLFFTPGVPSEFKVMVEREIVPRLRERFDLPDPPLCLRMTTFGRGESDLANELDGLPLPEEVVLGYRSSMPIIELKLTGPAHEREAMELVWQQIRAVAGDSQLYEGTDDLPTRLGQQLPQRGLTLALAEQFTAGMVTWQCRSAGVPVTGGEWWPEAPESAGPSVDLAALAQQAAQLAQRHGASLGLVVGALEQDHFSVALHTPGRDYAQTIVLRNNLARHPLRARQEVVALMALTMLQRWLLGWEVYVEYGWVRLAATL